MSELLIELFSEEIPARMQARAEADFKSAVVAALKEAGVEGENATALSGPRRLTIVVDGLPARSADVEEERKGPRIDAPEKAIEGFLRGAGLTSVEEAETRSDPKKGEYYVAIKKTAGRALPEIVAGVVPQIIRGFHWPKSMRWGTGDLRWVRPLQRILCIFDGKTVAFDVDEIESGNQTEGHRVHGRGPYTIKSFADYQTKLEGEGHVRLTRADRKALIAKDAAAACKKAGLELVEDEGLLEEVTGLAEWPVVVLGEMDPAFLELPPEVIRLSMRTHQKYFAVRDPKTGNLAPNFITVANIDAADGGKTIAAGNAKVLSARLEDGRFFWENDKKTPLEEMAKKLATIDFKKELGTIADKVERVAALARELAPKVGADPDVAEKAARLAKADLVSEMVYEFPELQGVMGRYYALEQREPSEVADAIRDHYKPQGPSDAVPTEPVAVSVALADKLDTLVGFWAIDEKPTGSKDPFALRRAALGVVRIVLENGLRLRLKAAILSTRVSVPVEQPIGPSSSVESAVDEAFDVYVDPSLLAFFADRLKQVLRDKGERHDLIDAVFALGEDDLVLIVNRVQALGAFLETEDGTELMAGYKRAANILKAEEKKDGATYTDFASVDAALLSEKAEQALHTALVNARASAEAALKDENFEGAMAALAKLRAPVDAFFETVTVNDDKPDVRRNRLLILAGIRDALLSVADVSKIEG